MSAHLYVTRYGDKVKIGITGHLPTRYRAYRRDAAKAGVAFEPLFELPLHREARENERALLARFGVRGSIEDVRRLGSQLWVEVA